MDGMKISQLPVADAATFDTCLEVAVPDASAPTGYASKRIDLAQLKTLLASKGNLAEQSKSFLQAGYGGYSDVTASRAINTQYFNTTGRPLDILIRVSNQDTSLIVDYCIINEGSYILDFIALLHGRQGYLSATIPPGGGYTLSNFGSNAPYVIYGWAEG